MSKELKKFIRQLILCILIKEIIQGNITIDEAHALIDASSEAQRIQYEKRKNEKKIKEMNDRFISLTQRFRHGNNQNEQNNQNNSQKYKSYFSKLSVD
jgi:hypothetical protein